MMLVLAASLPLAPVPKQSTRFSKDGSYTDERVAKWKHDAQHLLRLAMRQAGMVSRVSKGVPLRLDVEFVFARTQALKRGPRVRHVVRPDTDNLLKALKDALDGSRPRKGNRPGTPGLVVTDDSQITEVHATKWYAAHNEEAAVHFRLWRLDQAPAIAPGEFAHTDEGTPTPIATSLAASSTDAAADVVEEIAPGKFARTDEASDATAVRCKPHHRWAGGKRDLAPKLIANLPADWSGRYIAPFFGGGAVFWALHNADRLTGAHLSDANRALILSDQILRHLPENFLSRLEQHARDHGEEHYAAARDRFNALLPHIGVEMLPSVEVELAVLFTYLNSVCVNGLYRVRKSDGGFNAPLAKPPHRTAHDVLNPRRRALLRRNSRALKRPGVELVAGDFGRWLHVAQAGDFLFADPPYVPRPDQLAAGKTSHASYTAEGFSLGDQCRLSEGLHLAKKRGVLVATTNHDSSDIREMYPTRDGWFHTPITRRGAMSTDPTRRQAVPELLITSWPPLAPGEFARTDAGTDREST